MTKEKTFSSFRDPNFLKLKREAFFREGKEMLQSLKQEGKISSEDFIKINGFLESYREIVDTLQKGRLNSKEQKRYEEKLKTYQGTIEKLLVEVGKGENQGDPSEKDEKKGKRPRIKRYTEVFSASPKINEQEKYDEIFSLNPENEKKQKPSPAKEKLYKAMGIDDATLDRIYGVKKRRKRKKLKEQQKNIHPHLLSQDEIDYLKRNFYGEMSMKEIEALIDMQFDPKRDKIYTTKNGKKRVVVKAKDGTLTTYELGKDGRYFLKKMTEFDGEGKRIVTNFNEEGTLTQQSDGEKIVYGDDVIHKILDGKNGEFYKPVTERTNYEHNDFHKDAAHTKGGGRDGKETDDHKNEIKKEIRSEEDFLAAFEALKERAAKMGIHLRLDKIAGEKDGEKSVNKEIQNTQEEKTERAEQMGQDHQDNASLDRGASKNNKDTKKTLSLREQKLRDLKMLGFDYGGEIVSAKQRLEEAKKRGDTKEIENLEKLIAELSTYDRKFFENYLKEKGIEKGSEEYEDQIAQFEHIHLSYAKKLAEQKIAKREEEKQRILQEKAKGKRGFFTRVLDTIKGDKDIAGLNERIRLEEKKLKDIDKRLFELKIRNEDLLKKFWKRTGRRFTHLKESLADPKKRKKLLRRLGISATMGVLASSLGLVSGGAVLGAGYFTAKSFAGFVGAESAGTIFDRWRGDSRKRLLQLREKYARGEALSSTQLEAYKQRRDKLLDNFDAKALKKNKLKRVIQFAAALLFSYSTGHFLKGAGYFDHHSSPRHPDALNKVQGQNSTEQDLSLDHISANHEENPFEGISDDNLIHKGEGYSHAIKRILEKRPDLREHFGIKGDKIPLDKLKEITQKFGYIKDDGSMVGVIDGKGVAIDIKIDPDTGKAVLTEFKGGHLENGVYKGGRLIEKHSFGSPYEGKQIESIANRGKDYYEYEMKAHPIDLGESHTEMHHYDAYDDHRATHEVASPSHGGEQQIVENHIHTSTEHLHKGEYLGDHLYRVKTANGLEAFVQYDESEKEVKTAFYKVFDGQRWHLIIDKHGDGLIDRYLEKNSDLTFPELRSLPIEEIEKNPEIIFKEGFNGETYTHLIDISALDGKDYLVDIKGSLEHGYTVDTSFDPDKIAQAERTALNPFKVDHLDPIDTSIPNQEVVTQLPHEEISNHTLESSGAEVSGSTHNLEIFTLDETSAKLFENPVPLTQELKDALSGTALPEQIAPLKNFLGAENSFLSDLSLSLDKLSNGQYLFEIDAENQLGSLADQKIQDALALLEEKLNLGEQHIINYYENQTHGTELRKCFIPITEEQMQFLKDQLHF